MLPIFTQLLRRVLGGAVCGNELPVHFRIRAPLCVPGRRLYPLIPDGIRTQRKLRLRRKGRERTSASLTAPTRERREAQQVCWEHGGAVSCIQYEQPFIENEDLTSTAMFEDENEHFVVVTMSLRRHIRVLRVRHAAFCLR